MSWVTLAFLVKVRMPPTYSMLFLKSFAVQARVRARVHTQHLSRKVAHAIPLH
jgi:hypothetical protein